MKICLRFVAFLSFIILVYVLLVILLIKHVGYSTMCSERFGNFRHAVVPDNQIHMTLYVYR